MIIIDEHAENKLSEMLESQRARAVLARCIHLRLAAKNVPQLLPQLLIGSVERALPSAPQIYLCEDGDIFILAPMIMGKEFNKIIAELVQALHLPALEQWADLYELNTHLGRLLVILEQKLDKQRLSSEEQRNKAALERTKLKRNYILNQAGRENTVDIRSRRWNRGQPEIMIIEDDVFSLRLVENVLREQYKLTGINTAERALSTYARVAPDLLFLDINLPDVSGHELLEKIIALDPDAYVVMLSGNCDRENILQAINHGAKGFIAKPFTRDKLFQYIERCPTISH